MIAVPKGNPKGIKGPADLANPAVKVALCAEQVPCGAASKKALDAAGVSITPVTQEQDVKAALSKLTLGEVDAALVYRTDAKAEASAVDGIEFPESAERHQRLPDRGAQGRTEPGGRGSVRRLRRVGTGGGRSDRGRVPDRRNPIGVTSIKGGDLNTPTPPVRRATLRSRPPGW